MSFEGLSEIGQINVPVRDLDRAVAFYRDLLGMKFLFQVPNMAFFACGGMRLLLGIAEIESFNHLSSIIYFKVPDLIRATEVLRSRGVEITGEPELVAKMPDHDLWMSFFLDSEGNTMSLMSEVRQS